MSRPELHPTAESTIASLLREIARKSTNMPLFPMARESAEDDLAMMHFFLGVLTAAMAWREKLERTPTVNWSATEIRLRTALRGEMR